MNTVPAIVIDEYLDNLRKTGVTNMFGAAPYLQREFGLSRYEARDELTRWMREFSNRVKEQAS